MSSFPSIFFRNFSEKKNLSQERLIDVDQLTRSSLFHLLCRDPEDCEHFDHDLDDDVRHCRSRLDFRV